MGNPFLANAYIDRNFYKMNGNGTEIMAGSQGSAIAPMEGVFVMAEEYGEPLSFSKTASSSRSYFAINLNNGRSVIDRVIVRFGEGRQLPKFQLNPKNTKVYIPHDNKDFSVVSVVSDMGEMPVDFKASEDGIYTLGFSSENVSFGYLHLIDNLTGVDVDLLANPSYSFNAQATDSASRFRLVFAISGGLNLDDNDSTKPAFASTRSANLPKLPLHGLSTDQDADENIILYDGTDLGDYNGKKVNVTLQGRTLLKDGCWNTLCLPFNLNALSGTPLAGATLKELDVTNKWSMVNGHWSINGNGTYQTQLAADGTLYLFFKDASVIEAGKPYIIMWTGGDNIENPVFTGVTICEDAPEPVTFNGGKFVGTYTYTQYTTENTSVLFLGGNNTLYYPQPDQTSTPAIGAFRAYFDLGSNKARTFHLNLGDSMETQGIVSLNPDPGLTIGPSPEGEGSVYTLNGVRLGKMPALKGIYIRNGRKLVIK